jgi:hypothetical protein
MSTESIVMPTEVGIHVLKVAGEQTVVDADLRRHDEVVAFPHDVISASLNPH